MNWIKERWAAIVVAFGVFLGVLAMMAASREKKVARQWQERAVSIEEGTVTESLETANAANTQAKLHEGRAKERAKKAEARLNQAGDADEEVADILDRWSKS